MKIVYQQRNKLKNTCILFPMTTDNSDNMLYYYYLSKEEKRAKKTCYKRIEKLKDKNKCEMLEECF